MKNDSDELPPSWTCPTLSQLVEGAQSGFASGEKAVLNGLQHFRMNNIGEEGALVLDLLRTVPPKLAKEQHKLRLNDVLVCTTNSGKLVGKCALFDQSGDFAFSNHITRLRPKKISLMPTISVGRFGSLGRPEHTKSSASIGAINRRCRKIC